MKVFFSRKFGPKAWVHMTHRSTLYMANEALGRRSRLMLRVRRGRSWAGRHQRAGQAGGWKDLRGVVSA